VQAIEALMKLKSKGVLFRVEATAPLLHFDFEGYITELDDTILLMTAPQLGQETGFTLTLSGLQVWRFDGDFREDDSSMFLALDIARPTEHASIDMYRVHVVGSWNPDDIKPSHVN
jgi:hypothetical protein